MKLIKRIAFGSAGLLVLLMMTATVIEKMQGTDTAWSVIYGSPFFTALWGVMTVCAFVYLMSRKLQRDFFTFLLHIAFLIVLAGALTTRLCGKQGSIHLRMNDTPVSAFVTSGTEEEPLPFDVRLHDFRIDYYKGSFAPMDFTSRIRIEDNGMQAEGEVSMNRIFTYRHYRFYQSAYDKDGQGTTLAVSYDPWGIGITYTGYALLLLSVLGFFFQKDSMFRRLLRHPALRNKTVLLGIALLSSVAGMASEQPKHLSREAASAVGNLYIYYHDRICPLQTLAKDFTVKLYGKTTYKGLTAEQVFTGWFFYYDDWKAEPVIRIKSQEVQRRLGIGGDYACLNDFFGTEGYKLKENGTGSSQYKREWNEANEKFNLISMTATGSILKIYPCRTEHNRTGWFAPVDDLPQDLPDEQWLFVRKSLGLLSEQVMKKNDAAILELTGKIRKYQQKIAGEVLPSDTWFPGGKAIQLFGLYPAFGDGLPYRRHSFFYLLLPADEPSGMRQDPCECLFACRIGYHCGLSLVAYRPEGIRQRTPPAVEPATRRCSFWHCAPPCSLLFSTASSKPSLLSAICCAGWHCWWRCWARQIRLLPN